MEELVKGSIIQLENEKLYLIIDSYKIHNEEYVMLIDTEEPDDDQEEIFILKNCKDNQGIFYLDSISEEEYNKVLIYCYKVYENAGILNNNQLEYNKLYKSIFDEDIINSAKEETTKNDLDEYIKKMELKLNSAKELFEKDKELLKEYQEKVDNLKNSNDKLQEYNQFLNEKMNKVPKLIRKIFLRDNETKLLK